MSSSLIIATNHRYVLIYITSLNVKLSNTMVVYWIVYFIFVNSKLLIMKDIVFEIKKRFEEALEAKTGWGKNEIKSLHNKIIIEVLSEKVLTK